MTEEPGLPEASSLERLIPLELNTEETTGSETPKFHLDRYKFAEKHLVPGSVLDIACGVGYGTVVLAESPRAAKVVGVDLSREAIRYGQEHYHHERVSYVCSSADEFEPEEAFENIVSLETIEHLDRPAEFFSRLVAPGEDHALICVDRMTQIQPYSAVAMVTRREKRAADLRRSIALFYLRYPSHLFLRLWSTLRDGFVNKYLTIVWEKPR